MDHQNNREITLTAAQANVRALAFMLPILLLYALPYLLLWHGQFTIANLKAFARTYEANLLYFPFLMFLIIGVGAVVHELLHGVTWAVFCKRGFSSISFGIYWKILTPYCHCKEPLRLKHYLLGGLMPGFILGLLPAVYGIVLGNFGWWLFGLFFTFAAAGDLLIVWMLRRQNSNDLVQDHPEKIGCFILERG
ncbi:DUF3267 domain-containing protein [Pontibacter ruber]|uniref:DUF3267 domain-containing protein n=1 Tax=Pontibacter ruber TaxID=1343895 RepID=A0ABW5CV82_9BACT|nr:DUF3267 domain-containing protein [Pontibacter ruber]